MPRRRITACRMFAASAFPAFGWLFWFPVQKAFSEYSEIKTFAVFIYSAEKRDDMAEIARFYNNIRFAGIFDSALVFYR